MPRCSCARGKQFVSGGRKEARLPMAWVHGIALLGERISPAVVEIAGPISCYAALRRCTIAGHRLRAFVQLKN